MEIPDRSSVAPGELILRAVTPTCRALAAVTALFLASGYALGPQTRDSGDKPAFRAAEAVSVTDIAYPIASFANGTSVLDVVISETGRVKDIEVRRDLVPLTPEAIRAVRNWKFLPATLAGKPVASRITVAVNFHPPTLFAAPVPLPPLKHRTDQGRIQSSFQPAEVIAAAFPIYPSAAIASGTVVLEAALSETGKVERTRVLLDLPPLTTEAVRAIEDWKFAPATLAGKPVKSKIVLAFVFRAPPPPPLP